jgi:uncharacterized membrane protein YeaQ/YmgE (transglycosylase-associated protein family)
MQKTGKSLMECISEYKGKIDNDDKKEDLKEGFSKFIKITYRISLIAVFLSLIYFRMDENTIEFLKNQQYYLIGMIVFGIVIGGLVRSFWDTDNTFMVNSIIGIIGSVIGVFWTMSIFSGDDYGIFHLLFGVALATSLLFLIFNFIASFGGLIISLILAIAFGFSHYEELLVLLNQVDQSLMILAVATGFTSLHLWVTKGPVRMTGAFIYTVIISCTGCIFGVLVLNESMDFSDSAFINSAICAFIGSSMFLLLTDFVDAQDPYYY